MSNIEIDNGAERSDSADSIITTEEVSNESTIALPIGTELSGQDIYQIAASEKTQMFVIIGATGSGKTTLVTSIYHLLLSGSNITDFLFAGSNTLAAFEKRAFSLRTSSMQSHGEMMRTQRGSVDSFLHLRLKLTHTDEIRNLLFSDFSGEDFESVLANTEATADEFGFIKAARHLIFLLDGEKIASKKYRYSELQRLIHMLRTFLAANLITKNNRIVVAVSKYDLIKKESTESLGRFMDGIQDEIVKQIPDIKDICTIQYIAPMPDDEKTLPTLYGLNDLLNSLLGYAKNEYTTCGIPSLSSQFNKWKVRRL